MVSFDDPPARELMRSLPDVLLVQGDAAASGWSVRDTLRLMAEELAHPQPGGAAVATRLADILVMQAIRGWLAAGSDGGAGWLRGLGDERIGRALEAVHAEPGAEWSTDRLARVAAMSRSSFTARFAELVGEAPVAYLTRWRMSVAQSRLAEEGISVARLAGELGYRSEAAFSRAFTRTVGRTPGAVRRSRAAGSGEQAGDGGDDHAAAEQRQDDPGDPREPR